MLDFLKGLQKDYRITFKGEPAKEVLSDLRVFCYATKSPFSKDAYEMARNVGRKEVFDRIITMLKYDIDDVYQLEHEDLE